MALKKWGGWEVIRKADLEKVPEPPPKASEKKLEKGLDPKKLEKIETRKITEAEQEAYARQLSKIDQIAKPEVCALCGNSIQKEFFLLRTPEPIRICRSCKQSDNRCPNCGEVHRIEVKGLTGFCRNCKGKECVSCGTPITPDEIRRVEGKKGVYCESCFSGKERCSFCALPTKRRLEGSVQHLCVYCKVESVTDEGKALDILDGVLQFFYKLDESLVLEVLPVAFENSLLFQAKNDVFYFPKGVPESWLQGRFVEHYARETIRRWKKVKPASPLAVSLSIFFQMLFADHLKDFLRFEEWKKTGLRAHKEFQPLYQTFYKSGAGPALRYLKKLLA